MNYKEKLDDYDLIEWINYYFLTQLNVCILLNFISLK